MTFSARDAIVIGGGVSGLVAACYLARGGLRTLLLEARPVLGGLCADPDEGREATRSDLLYALDRTVIRELSLARRGLKFAVRDLPLVGLRDGGRHVVLGRNPRTASGFIAPHSESDAATYARFRRTLLGQAREARRVWWRGTENGAGSPLLQRLSRLPAAALLDSWFESDALKATLAFDASAGGVSIEEAPSTLTLLWRAAQESSGLQAATGVTKGSPSLVSLLANRARDVGVEIRTGAEVGKILVGDGAIGGVTLSAGETIETPLVLASASRRRVASLLPPAQWGIGAAIRQTEARASAAQLGLSLDPAPDARSPFSDASRFVIAENLESFVAAHEASNNGRLPEEIVFEAVGVPMHGRYEVSVHVRPLPRHVQGGWKQAGLAVLAKVIARLSHFDRGIKDRLHHFRIVTPDDVGAIHGESEAPNVARLLASTNERIETCVAGLYLCGGDAEPVDSISGRAARSAALRGLMTHAARAEERAP